MHDGMQHGSPISCSSFEASCRFASERRCANTKARLMATLSCTCQVVR